MNTKIYFVSALASMALLSGCSDNELASVETSQEKTPIGFHTVGSQMGSRATIITPSNLTTTDFNVFAFTNDGTAFMGENKNETTGLPGVNISYQNGKWDYTNKTDLKYWPTTPLDFYAVNPVKPADGSIAYLWEITKDKKEITYHSFDEYTSGKSNIDVMYAIANNQTKASKYGTVSLKFHHILSQVAFRANTLYSSMKVDIKEIKIYNFKTGGTFTFPDNATTPPSQNNWSLGGTYSKPFNIITKADNDPVVINNASKATDITIANPMLFAPQNLTAWDTSHNLTVANKNEESYLEINCKITQNGVYLHGSATDYAKLYVPFEASWEPGKRYIYTLIFGGGYDANGNAILLPINFDADITDWEDGTVTDPNFN